MPAPPAFDPAVWLSRVLEGAGALGGGVPLLLVENFLFFFDGD